MIRNAINMELEVYKDHAKFILGKYDFKNLKNGKRRRIISALLPVKHHLQLDV